MGIQNKLATARQFLSEHKFYDALSICSEMYDKKILPMDGFPLFAKCLICVENTIKAHHIIQSISSEACLSAIANKEMGDCFAILKDWGLSEEYYNRSLSQDPLNLPALEQKAKIKQICNDYIAAILIYNKLLKIDPKNTEYYVNIAKLKILNQDFSEAKCCLEAALAINPSAKLANHFLGLICQIKSDFRNAQIYYSRELKFYPGDCKTLVNVGNIYLNLNQFSDAENVLRYCVDTNPTQQSIISLAKAYQCQNKFVDASILYESLLSRKEFIDNEVYFSASDCFFRIGKFDLAKKLIEIYLENGGKNSNSLGLAIKIALKTGDYQLLGDFLDQITCQNGTSINAHLEVVDFLVTDENNDSHVIDILSRALAIQPHNARANALIASVYCRRNRLKEALKHFELSLQHSKSDINTIFNFAFALKKSRKFSEAVLILEQLFSIDSSHADAYLLYAEVLLELGDFNGAESAADRSINLSVARLGAAYHIKAACFFSKGNFIKARHFIDRSLEQKQSLYVSQSLVLAAKKAIDVEIKCQNKNSSDLPQSDQILWPQNGFYSIDRSVSSELVDSIRAMRSFSLSLTNDSRFGCGFQNNFNLFASNDSAISKLAEDIKLIIKDLFNKSIYNMEYDSFFNIFNGQSGTNKHCHISPQDKLFNLAIHKITLVYYICSGDLNCDNPGVLKMYDPDYDILPYNGLMVISPSDRFHSSSYSGFKDRIMIGSNFYIF